MTKMLSAGTLGKKGGWAYIREWAYYRASTVSTGIYGYSIVLIMVSTGIDRYRMVSTGIL